MTNRKQLSEQQDAAANPCENVWVQANAGTGKTSVLTQRLLRILFRTESDLSNKKSGILCLTFTKAGVGEMQNRILYELRKWAGASDNDLSDLLIDVSVNKIPDKKDIKNARNVFYKYIDNSDLLKIKTIHGFCEEILRRFPIEAGVSPSWGLVTNSNQKILLSDTFNKTINSSESEKNTPDKNGTLIQDAFANIVSRIPEGGLEKLFNILIKQYKQFFQISDFDNYRKYFIDKTEIFLELKKETSANFSRKALEDIIINAKSDKKPAKYLENIITLTGQYIDNSIDFEIYKKAYLTAKDTKNPNVFKKGYLREEQERVYNLNQYYLNKMILTDTISLFDLSASFAKNYKGLKSTRNLLDFDDLILYTRALFLKPDSMGWVLHQMDTSLNHILVDEAQDTSPEQWDILRLLAGDFFTDGDVAGREHSLFIVGDTKQSIYGFQGADPMAFADSREDIATQIKNNMRTIREIPLTQSFRSVEPILKVVDFFFANPQIRGISGFINNDHKCFRGAAPGLVELHTVYSKYTEK